MQRRLAAILSADVVGYSRLMATDEEGTLGALAGVAGQASTWFRATSKTSKFRSRR